MKTSFKIFTFLGSPVEVSLWFLILALIFPLTTFISIFIAVLIHEMAHVLITDYLGYRSWGIKIDLLFGTAQIQKDIPERDSIPILVAGPLSNLFLSAVSAIVAFGLYLFDFSGFVTQLFESAVVINFLMFLFNIIPIYPLDGGRILRDILTLKMTSKEMALKISAWSSLLISIILVILSAKFGLFIMSIFAIIFIYLALCDLKVIRVSDEDIS